MEILLSSSQTIKNQLDNMEQVLVSRLRKNPINPIIFSLLETGKVNELRGTGGLEMSI